MQAHQPIRVGQGHVVDDHTLRTIEPIDGQVGAQFGDIPRQALEGVNMGGTDVAGWLKILRRPQGIKVGIAAPMALG